MGNYANKKGRSSGKSSYLGIPKTVADHDNFTRLSGWGAKLLLLVAKQYNGYNNGDLSATWKQAKLFGFRSESTLSEAKKEVLHYRLITLTRAGGTNKPTLYALTWNKIDECKRKLDISPTKNAPGCWKDRRPDFVRKSQRSAN